MRRSLLLVLASIAAAGVSRSQAADNLVLVAGGVFRNQRSGYFGKSELQNVYLGRMAALPDFYIGRYEVTQTEWSEVMGDNPSKFKGGNLPVENVSWYDCIEYCNRRSAKEGLQPYYTIDRNRKDPDNQNAIDTIKWTVTINTGANGYRLPTEAEWEYAADGGQLSRSFLYSGSDILDDVAWYFANAGDKPLTGFWSWPAVEHNHDKTHPVGTRKPNELGLYDMSGNVREWCWNWYGDSPATGTGPAQSAAGRVWRGGGWMGGDFCCASSYRAAFEASGRGPDQGFRICRSK